MPATCAPTSTTSSGSTVPVAEIVVTMSPRATAAVLNFPTLSTLRWVYQYAPYPMPPSRITTRTITMAFRMVSPIAPKIVRFAGGARRLHRR